MGTSFWATFLIDGDASLKVNATSSRINSIMLFKNFGTEKLDQKECKVLTHKGLYVTHADLISENE